MQDSVKLTEFATLANCANMSWCKLPTHLIQFDRQLFCQVYAL